MSTPHPPARRAAVLGHPVTHSLSPVLHTAAYRALGLRGWTYEAFDVEESGLPEFLARLDGTWAGLSLTMPLKRAVRPFLSRISGLAAEVGATNTVVVTPDGLHGYNTDVFGVIKALAEAGAERVGAAAILGAGATAASALAALRDLGCTEPIVHLRTPGRAADLLAAAERLGVRPRLVGLDDRSVRESGAWVRDVGGAVVSTLPPGAADSLFAPLAEEALRASGREPETRLPALLDVVYSPWPTRLAQAWASAGGRVASGFAMLVHQAEGQVELMTGARPPLDLMRQAGEAELLARGAPLGRAGTR